MSIIKLQTFVDVKFYVRGFYEISFPIDGKTLFELGLEIFDKIRDFDFLFLRQSGRRHLTETVVATT
jgi:hypothetical protein